MIEPDIEKALLHLDAAHAEAMRGIDVSGWAEGESPNPVWWYYQNARRNIESARNELEILRRRRKA